MKKTLSVSPASGTQEPVLRVGLMTDTHIGEIESRCQNIRKAFVFFKDQKIDLMVHLGDIADCHYKSGYEIARQYINEIFGNRKPKELWIYASHDSVGRRDKPWEKELKEELQIPNDPYDKLVLKGYPFLVFPQDSDMERQEKAIRKAVNDHPGKPVFVLDHVPAAYTTENSWVWGSWARREILEKYPQVVQLSGHSHNTLCNERCIWQGKFTAVNCGCMQEWAGDLPGTEPDVKSSDEVMVMEIFPDKIRFRCYSTSDGKEIRPDRPWCIPWPFDPGKAPYDPERLKKTSPKPQFDKDAKVVMAVKGTPFEKLLFTVPEAKHPEKCYRYILTLKRKSKTGAWKMVTSKEYFGNFWQRKAPETVIAEFSAGFFEEDGEYQLKIVPRNYYGGEGKPLYFEFKAPKPRKGKVVFECKNPMKELPYLLGLGSLESVKRTGRFYSFPGGYTRLLIPGGVWAGKKGIRFRFIIDLGLDQPENSNWTAVLRNPVPEENANVRISTPRKSANHRIVIDFAKQRDDADYYLLLREGLPGKIAFRYVRIERF